MRLQPEKPVQLPVLSRQKNGILGYVLFLLLFMVILWTGAMMEGISWILYLYLLFSTILAAHHWLNLFAVMEDGILCGRGFIPWDRIRSYFFETIDIHHRFYGFSKEVNDKYELNIQTKFSTIHCIIANEGLKRQIEEVLKEKIKKHRRIAK